MKYYIDTEFDGHGGPLLSFAVVAEDGRSCHFRTGVRAMDIWVIHNVEPLMDSHGADIFGTLTKPNNAGPALKSFIGNDAHPVIVADSPVDIGRICQAISTNSEGSWTSADYPAITFEVRNVDCYPTTLPGAVQHNAWWDAMALRHLLSTEDVDAITPSLDGEGSVGAAEAIPTEPNPSPSQGMREEIKEAIRKASNRWMDTRDRATADHVLGEGADAILSLLTKGSDR